MSIRGKIIEHKQLPPTTCLMPLPAVLVTCRDLDGHQNIITIAWTGIVCSQPPMLSISVRPGRFSHSLLDANGDFVVNVPSAGSVNEADLCGMLSGRDIDKFQQLGWTTMDAATVNAPLIREMPLALECRTRQKLSLGTHDMYVAEILGIQAHAELLDANGRLRIDDLSPLAFCPNVKGLGEYWSLKEVIGHYGVSKEEHRL
jgi:flavin reductase (DIM6/NTAB) family NADH-FMN oxidoreductase RutF